jgi:hypothetical protein
MSEHKSGLLPGPLVEIELTTDDDDPEAWLRRDMAETGETPPWIEASVALLRYVYAHERRAAAVAAEATALVGLKRAVRALPYDAQREEIYAWCPELRAVLGG